MSLLWLTDTSPLFFYSPAPQYFADTAYTLPWTTLAASEQRGLNDTHHLITSPGAFILPNVYATSFTPIFSPSDGYNAGLVVGTGEPKAWSSGQNYSDFRDSTVQTFTMAVSCSAQCGQEGFGFTGAWLGTQFSPHGSTEVSALIDDSSPLVTYSGFAPIIGTTTGVTVEAMDHSGTLSVTSTSGASASVNFDGASLVVHGVTGPSLGGFTVSLDGSLVATLNAHSDVEAHGVVLYFVTNLDTSFTHTLTLTATGEQTSVGLVIDSWTAYGPLGAVRFSGVVNGAATTVGPESGGATNTGTLPVSQPTGTGLPAATDSGGPNAGLIVGAILGALAGAVSLQMYSEADSVSASLVIQEEDDAEEAGRQEVRSLG